MATARDLITTALRKIGVIRKSEAPTADEAEDAFEELNRMIASWSNDSLLLYARTLENFTLSGGTATYTIGSGQTFNTVKPMNIVSAYLRDGTSDYSIAIIPDEDYQNITDKSSQGIPAYLNFTNGHPSATVKLYPVPSSSYSLYILTEKPLSAISTLDTTIDLPAGWEDALIYNLALRLAPEYGAEINPLIVEMAAETTAGLRRNQIKNRPITLLEDLGNRYDIYSGGL